MVSVLVTAPQDERGSVDIMSLLAGYLSFASEESVETVLRYIEEDNTVGDIWKGVLGPEGVEFVQSVVCAGM